jgi:hypothetical protein
MSFNDWLKQWFSRRWYVVLLVLFLGPATVQFLGDTFWPPFDMTVASVIGLIISWSILYIIFKTQNP